MGMAWAGVGMGAVFEVGQCRADGAGKGSCCRKTDHGHAAGGGEFRPAGGAGASVSAAARRTATVRAENISISTLDQRRRECQEGGQRTRKE